MQSFPDTRVLQKAHIDAINSQHPYALAQKPEAEWITEEHVRTKVNLVLEWFRDLSKLVDLPRLAAGTFLDIGAGMGVAVKAAEIYGFRRAIGIEFDSQHVRMARERLNVELLGNAVEQIELPGDVSFIRMNHVLEHIERPVELLKRVRAVLANPGVLYVGVPNMRALSVRLWWTWHRYFQAVHINYFDAGSLRAAAAAAGFLSVRILTDQFSLKKLLSNPLGATHVGKYYLQGVRIGLASRLGLRLAREVGGIYPVALDRALIRLFPFWGDNLVCLAHTDGVVLSRSGARS
jgi:SAM-dependent methyltransferase